MRGSQDKDYYGILGVDKNSDSDTIKKAYRKLAMKYHPDQNKGDTASEDKFKDISEAYEVLSNPKKKRSYDMGGSSSPFSHFSGMGDIFGAQFKSQFRTTRRTVSLDNKAVFRADISQIIKGGEVTVEFNRHFACEECKGNAVVPTGKSCNLCGGSGRVQSGAGNMYFVTACHQCEGSGVETSKCNKCNGKGYDVKREKVKVKIPSGISPLSTMRIKGKGNVLFSSNSKIYGDGYLVVDYPRVQNGVSLDNGNIILSLKVPFNSVLSEETITVDVLGCKTLEVKLDGSHPSGYQYEVDGGGVSPDKKAFVKVFIDTPKNKLSKESQSKLNKVLGEVYGKPIREFKIPNN